MFSWFPYHFAQPQYFLLLLAVPAWIWWFYFRKKSYYPAFLIPQEGDVFNRQPTGRVRLQRALPAMRILAYSLLVVALARPQRELSDREVSTDGIDIILSLDISGSMLARDFKPDRLEAAKKVAMDFIRSRPNDRIGLVVFSGESFTQCPLTIDHQVLLNLFKDIKSGMVEDGTAIGMGLATAVARLKESKSKTKVIILMTDGVNNSGYIDPESAIQLAKTYGIRIYTIGVGRNGMAPYPVTDQNGKTFFQNLPVQIDEALLKRASAQTGGIYFRATGNDKLESVYAQIDQLERSKIRISNYQRKSEQFHWFLGLALLGLLVESVLRNTYLKTLVG